MAFSRNSVPRDFRSLAFGNSTQKDSATSYRWFLPRNDRDEDSYTTARDVYACDQFRMFEFKVRRCMWGRSHDWTDCPFAHPGEKARRRDPRRYHYSGTACPLFRKGICRNGDACENAHGVFESWLHPARYRTRPCKDGTRCRRRVCFFAHTPEQLRLLPATAQAAGAAASNGGLNDHGPSAFSASGSGSYPGPPSRSGNLSDGAFTASSSTEASRYSHPPFAGSAHMGHYSASPQESSPTSTLVGHSAQSAPLLSTPLVPRLSPFMSPQSLNPPSLAPCWDPRPLPPTGRASHSRPPAASNVPLLQIPPAHGAYTQGPRSHWGSNSSTTAPHPHNVQSFSSIYRRDLDRLTSMPAQVIPQDRTHTVNRRLQADSAPLLSSPSSFFSTSSSGETISSNPYISEFVTRIDQPGLVSNRPVSLWAQAQTLAAANQYSSGLLPLSRCSEDFHSPSMNPMYESRNRSRRGQVEEPPAERVESGRTLRAQIYSKLGT